MVCCRAGWSTARTLCGARIQLFTDANGMVLEYLTREEPAFRILQKLVMDTNWLKSLKYYTRFR